MYFRLTLFNAVTLSLMALTVFMVYARFRYRLDANWPLLYYAIVVAYWQAFEGALNPYWGLTGLTSALLLRFEFLGGFPLTVVRAIEILFFGYILWRGLGLLLLWPW
jgi:hypothetical protein